MSTERPARVRIDWPACSARGLCAEVLPEVVDLDPWGYPLVTQDVPPESMDHARRAVQMCPRAAFHLT